MTKYKTQSFRNTFRNARKGMRLSLKSERNIRIHLFAGTLAIITGFYLKFSLLRFCLVFIIISMVISAEMMNSAIEFTLDSVYHNKYSKMVGMAKDIAAGAVMVITIAAIMVGVLLYIPPFFKLISSL